MTRIKDLADEIKEELHSAKNYAEEYLTFKAEGNNTWANRYKEMAQEELKHAGYIHDRVVVDIEDLRKIYTPPQDMLDKWDADHKKYIEKAAWIRQMLTM